VTPFSPVHHRRVRKRLKSAVLDLIINQVIAIVVDIFLPVASK
jgi:hypothetical protein